MDNAGRIAIDERQYSRNWLGVEGRKFFLTMRVGLESGCVWILVEARGSSRNCGPRSAVRVHFSELWPRQFSIFNLAYIQPL